jgi:hypothetical protein
MDSERASGSELIAWMEDCNNEKARQALKDPSITDLHSKIREFVKAPGGAEEDVRDISLLPRAKHL